MEVDLIELLIFFDDTITSSADEEIGKYGFRATREDGLIVELFFSTFEFYATFSVYNSSNTTISKINMRNCSGIRVLDQKKKHLEIIHSESTERCFLQLAGDEILAYTE